MQCNCLGKLFFFFWLNSFTLITSAGIHNEFFQMVLPIVSIFQLSESKITWLRIIHTIGLLETKKWKRVLFLCHEDMEVKKRK